ncbi:hypothetical protein K474DRAFT_215084 [Panus rudis PR-1116 ss-1]|nr:hypothetical protein K474DRAFT_215084 [Panus rudis PR-1116 ss-1]
MSPTTPTSDVGMPLNPENPRIPALLEYAEPPRKRSRASMEDGSTHHPHDQEIPSTLPPTARPGDSGTPNITAAAQPPATAFQFAFSPPSGNTTHTTPTPTVDDLDNIDQIVDDADVFSQTFSFQSRTSSSSTQLLPTPTDLNSLRANGNQPLWLMLHQDLEQQKAWLKKAEGVPCLVVHIWGNRADVSINPQLTHDLRRTILTFLDLPSDCAAVSISPPNINLKQQTTPGRPHRRPYAFFVTNITTHQRDKLLHRHIWITRAMTLSFFAARWHFHDFVCTLEGFTMDDSKEIAQTIHKHLNTTATWNVLAAMAGTPEEVAADSTIVGRLMISTLQSIRVTPIVLKKYPKDADRKTTEPVPIISVNVFIKSPAKKFKQWQMWQRHVTGIQYTSHMAGTGIAVPPYTCEGCFGVGHPSGMCPFRDIPGWQTPVLYGLNNGEGGNRNGRPGAGQNKGKGVAPSRDLSADHEGLI